MSNPQIAPGGVAGPLDVGVNEATVTSERWRSVLIGDVAAFRFAQSDKGAIADTIYGSNALFAIVGAVDLHVDPFFLPWNSG